MGRIFAVGDVHGCYQAFSKLLEALDLQPDDQLVMLGDYVDRGPDAKSVLQRLIHLRAQCQLTLLRGNHDQLMLEARANPMMFARWMSVGGDKVLDSYGTVFVTARLATIPAEHWALLDGTLLYAESADHIFVHACVERDVPMPEQTVLSLLWDKLDRPGKARGHASGKRVICGHTKQRSGQPLNLGHTVCIDTGCYDGLWLTALNVATNQFIQTNELGDLREGVLS